MTMRFLCAGVNHKTAPVALRERLAFSDAEALSVLGDLRGRFEGGQFAILSTCNRSEVYVARPVHGRPREEQLREVFQQYRGVPRAEYEGSLYVLTDAEAARHLSAVAAGLDSLVPGDEQVLGQARQALRLSRAAGTTGAALQELFQLALSVARQVRAETGVSAGRVSVASVAIGVARECLGKLSGRCVLSVGAGKMNARMLALLRQAGAGPLLVANRSPDRAAELASGCAGEVLAFDRLGDGLARADLVVCSTGSADPVVTAARARKALAGRGGRALLIVDIAVPRDVEEAVGRLPGVRLVNVDDLQHSVERNVARRRGQVEAGMTIVARRVEEFFHRLSVRQVAPVVEELYRQMRQAADEEVAAAGRKLTGQPRADEQVIRRAVHRALRRILHAPLTALRSAAGTDAARQQAAALRRLFGLRDEDEQREPEKKPRRRTGDH